MARPGCRSCTGLLAQCSRPTTATAAATTTTVTALAAAVSGAVPTPLRTQRLQPLLHQSRAASSSASSSSTPLPPLPKTQASHQPLPQQQGSKPRRASLQQQHARGFHTTPANAGIAGKLGDMARQAVKRTIEPYGAFGVTRRMYKNCTEPAAYSISAEARRNDTVPTTEDGEEIGTGSGVWHNELNLMPSFSTWSQVTMLHMYLIVTRLRCLEKDTYRMYMSMLSDHFFQEAEDKMDIVHHITSRGLRQRHLQDLFLAWRGVMLAYDEGLVRGDAVLASAVWRNLYKARTDVDLRDLACVVSWMRRSYMMFDRMPDEAILLQGGSSVFAWPSPANERRLVDLPASKELSLLLQQEKTQSNFVEEVEEARATEPVAGNAAPAETEAATAKKATAAA